jgi:hypothetical protein
MKKLYLSDEVIVTDPCYTEDTWCNAKLKNVKDGNYFAFAKKVDCDGWGTRISKLSVIHEEHLKENLKWVRVRNTDIGVDSGQCGIFSLDTFRKDDIFATKSEFYKKFPSLQDKALPGESWYGHMCDRTLEGEGWDTYFKGVVSRSGFGDGSYDLYVARFRRRIVGIMIDYHVDNSSYALFDWYKPLINSKQVVL